MAPLRKWCWKFREQRERLSSRVLTVRYGEEEGMIKDGGRFSFVWWRNLPNICEGAGLDVGNWFLDNLGRSTGDEFSTLF